MKTESLNIVVNDLETSKGKIIIVYYCAFCEEP